MTVDCRDGESDGDYLHWREDASSDVCRTDRIDMSVSLPSSFDVETPPPPYMLPKLMCMIPAYEEAPPPYESVSGSHSSETVASQQNVSHSAWVTSGLRHNTCSMYVWFLYTASSVEGVLFPVLYSLCWCWMGWLYLKDYSYFFLCALLHACCLSLRISLCIFWPWLSGLPALLFTSCCLCSTFYLLK